jgi:hypothetical protein
MNCANKQTNSVAFSPKANYTDWSTAAGRRILVPTFADRGVSSGQRGGSTRPLISYSRQGPLIFLPGSSSVILTRLCELRYRATTTQKIWYRRDSNPEWSNYNMYA